MALGCTRTKATNRRKNSTLGLYSRRMCKLQTKMSTSKTNSAHLPQKCDQSGIADVNHMELGCTRRKATNKAKNFTQNNYQADTVGGSSKILLRNVKNDPTLSLLRLFIPISKYKNFHDDWRYHRRTQIFIVVIEGWGLFALTRLMGVLRFLTSICKTHDDPTVSSSTDISWNNC